MLSRYTFLSKGLVESHPVAVGLCVDQYSITVKEQGFRPAPGTALHTGWSSLHYLYRAALNIAKTPLTSPHFAEP